jgi:hypothetical protein
MKRSFIYMGALAVVGLAGAAGPGCKKKTTDAIAVIPKGTTH